MANTSGYTSSAKFLHWLIVILLIVQFIVAWTMPHIGRNTPMTTLISLHFTVGIVILAVAILRLGWRVIQGEPTPLDGVPERARDPLATLFAAASRACPRVDQCLMARHAGRTLRS